MSGNSVNTVTCRSGLTRLAIVAAAVPAPPPPMTISRSFIVLLSGMDGAQRRLLVGPAIADAERDVRARGARLRPPAAIVADQHARRGLPEVGRAGLLIRAHLAGHQGGAGHERWQLGTRMQHVDVQAQRAA